MKKIYYVLIILLSFGCLSTSALVLTSQNVQHQKQINQSTPYYRYLKYYIVYVDSINIIFKTLSENDAKNLSKEEKKDYKLVKKIQEMMDANAWGEVLYKYPDFFPAYILYYRRCLEQKQYPEAQRMLIKIRTIDKYSQIFSEELINQSMADLYFKNKEYQNAIQYYLMYENKNLSKIAECYFHLGDYDNTLKYENLIKDKSYDDLDILYSVYFNKKNYTQANKYAKELTNKKYNYRNIMRIQATSSNDSDRLKYAYQARNTTINEAELAEANKIIVNLEQKKLDKQISALKQFIRLPKWEEYLKRFPPNISITEICTKQDEYFTKANQYLIKYDGQNLYNALNSLTQEFDSYISDAQNKYLKEQQELAQQALEEAKQREMIIQQQMIEAQRIRHYRNMQRIYYMTDPVYYSTPAFYSPWW